MRATLLLLALALAAVAAVPLKQERIVGGSVTNISQYPFGASLLYTRTGTGHHLQECGGTIVNNRAILTAAHCLTGDPPNRWRSRVGSSNANSDGIVFATNRLICHSGYTTETLENDIAVVLISGSFSFNDNVRAASIAGPSYYVADNAPVWAIGWGKIRGGGPISEQLRHAQVRIVNKATCRSRYTQINRVISDNMLCAGLLDVGGAGTCTGDSGGPLVHNSVVLGITSWGQGCALPRFPGVFTDARRYVTWIKTHV